MESGGWNMEDKDHEVNLFSRVVWAIWNDRNQICFEGKSSSMADIIDKARFSVASWISILPEFRGLTVNLVLFNRREVDIPQF